MTLLRTLLEVLLVYAGIGQAILIWLEVRAYRRFMHRSFLLLALGSALGLCYSGVSLAVYLVPGAAAHWESYLVAALILGFLQVPLAVVGILLLFKSYGRLHAGGAGVLPNTSPERTRDG
jgi:hypothetical protein